MLGEKTYNTVVATSIFRTLTNVRIREVGGEGGGRGERSGGGGGRVQFLIIQTLTLLGKLLCNIILRIIPTIGEEEE